MTVFTYQFNELNHHYGLLETCNFAETVPHAA